MIQLTDTDRADLEKLAGLRWPAEKIAAFFGWNAAELAAELSNPESEIRQIALRGEMKAQFELESRLQSDAIGGNLSAAKQYSDLLKERSFRLTKLDIFGAADNPDLYSEIQKYIESGCPGTLSDNDQLRLNLLQLIYAFDIRHGDRKTVRFLTRPPYNLSYDTARDMLSQALELFSPGKNVSKAAMRHHTAEAYDTIYHSILETAKTPQDFALAAGILDKRAKLLQLDQPDPQVQDPLVYRRFWRVNSLDPGILGLPPANRDVLGDQIDRMDAPSMEKRRIRMEAGIEDVDIVKMLEDVVEKEN